MPATREPASTARARIGAARERSGRAASARPWRALEALVWSAAVFGAWMLTLSRIDPQDLLVASGCSIAAGILGAAGRWAIGASWPFIGVVGRSLLRLPLATVLDSGAVIVNALRRRGGEFAKVPLADASGLDPHAASRRVQASLLISYAPASYVLDIDERDGTALIHQVLSPAPSPGDPLSR